jgi:gluconate 2-dehydrogenase gamma chain
LDVYATARFGAAFAGLGAAQQDAILSDMEADKATGYTPGSSAVCERIRAHALQGMFGDPAHGGNVGFVGWKLVRFPGPRLIVSANEQRLDARPKNQLKSTYSLPLFRHTPRRT